MKPTRFTTALAAVMATLAFSAAWAVRPGSDTSSEVEEVQYFYVFVINPPSHNAPTQTLSVPDGKIFILDRIIIDGMSRDDARVTFTLNVGDNMTNREPGEPNQISFRLPIVYSWYDNNWNRTQHSLSLNAEVDLRLKGDIIMNASQEGATSNVAGCNVVMRGRLISE